MKKIDTELYNQNFYAKSLRKDRQRSYNRIANYIVNCINPGSVVDYGCSTGMQLLHLRKLGVKDILGIEPGDDIWDYVDSEIKNNIIVGNLTDVIDLEREYDLALNVEVIEHIDKKHEDIVLKNITRHTKTLVFSAAHPGQGGVGHINEQPFDHWVKKLNKLGFVCDWTLTSDFRKYLKREKCNKWYWQNMSIFFGGK